jgi:hypothetical protein
MLGQVRNLSVIKSFVFKNNSIILIFRRLRPSEADFQTCDSIERFDSCVGWRKSDHGLMAPFFGDIALFGIHFQGPECKQRVLPQILSRAMREVDDGQQEG